VWTFKLRKGVKWQNLPPLNGRELTSADVKYCYEATPRKACSRSRSRKSRGWRRPTSRPWRIHLRTPNTLFPQKPRRAGGGHLSKEVLEEDGDLKKRNDRTGPFIMKEHTRR